MVLCWINGTIHNFCLSHQRLSLTSNHTYRLNYRGFQSFWRDLHRFQLFMRNLHFPNLFKSDLYRSQLFKRDLDRNNLFNTDLRFHLFGRSLHKLQLFKRNLHCFHLFRVDFPSSTYSDSSSHYIPVYLLNIQRVVHPDCIENFFKMDSLSTTKRIESKDQMSRRFLTSQCLTYESAFITSGSRQQPGLQFCFTIGGTGRTSPTVRVIYYGYPPYLRHISFLLASHVRSTVGNASDVNYTYRP